MTKNINYDVVIAGSGMGGICTASILAKRGYKVLLIEELERLGGRFSTLIREGFKIPTGALAIQTRGIIQSIFREVGAIFDVEEIGNTNVWMYGKWHELPESGQIRTLLSLLDNIGAKKSKLLIHLSQGTARQHILEMLKTMTHTKITQKSKLSFRDWLTQYTDDEPTIKLFHTLTSAISTVNDYEYPASHWFTYISKFGQGGLPYYGIARQGNVALAENLAKAIINHNGDVWLKSPLVRITVKDGQVDSLTVLREEREFEINVKVLVSDLGPKKTVTLAGRNSFSIEYLAMVDALQPSPIVANIIASDKPLVKSKGGLLFVGTNRIVSGIPLSNFSSELAPREQHLTVVWGTPSTCSELVNAKEEEKLNLDDIRQVFPDFARHGRILRTDVRNINDEFPALRSWMGYDMPQDTPLSNLFYVGDAVKPFGWEGLAACARGAIIASKMIDKYFKNKG